MGLCIRKDDDLYLFLFSVIIVNDERQMPPEPVRNTKNIKLLHWVNEGTTREVEFDDLLDDLEPTLVVDTQAAMEGLVFTFDSWEHMRYQGGLSPFSWRDLQNFRDEARARRDQFLALSRAAAD